MSVKLIAITRPADATMTAGEFIAYVARVSNPGNQINKETAPKLLKYLVRNKHWSPFEMANVVMEINTTRDIARQILRHRSFTFQEFSQRYAEVTNPPIFREARLQDPVNRQNSLATDDEVLKQIWQTKQESLMAHVEDDYRWALQNGIAKEQARAILPEGLTPTKLYVNGTVRSWVHYCQLRMKNGTQQEHADIAKECWELITKELFDLDGVLDA